jgi:hypothetical protein
MRVLTLSDFPTKIVSFLLISLVRTSCLMKVNLCTVLKRRKLHEVFSFSVYKQYSALLRHQEFIGMSAHALTIACGPSGSVCYLPVCLLGLFIGPEDGGGTFIKASTNFCHTMLCHIPKDSTSRL